MKQITDCYKIINVNDLNLDFDKILSVANEVFSNSVSWYYAEPNTVIESLGQDRVFQDAEVDDNEYIKTHIADKIILPKDASVYITFYKLPSNNGLSPIHVDYEFCNILIPLHDTEEKAYAKFYEWPDLEKELTETDWELYNKDWDNHPICEFTDNLPEIATYYWKKHEAVLFNTRQPHASYNFSKINRINLVISFYNISYLELFERISSGELFKRA